MGVKGSSINALVSGEIDRQAGMKPIYDILEGTSIHRVNKLIICEENMGEIARAHKPVITDIKVVGRFGLVRGEQQWRGMVSWLFLEHDTTTIREGVRRFHV